MMRPRFPLAALLPTALAGPLLAQTPAPAQPRGDLILATTTSTQDSGLLDSLLPVFFDRNRIRVKVIAPEAERQYVASGDLVEGRLVMHNDFLIIGPEDDPAGVLGLADLADVMRRIARTGPFVARGDGSGTEKKELELWRRAGVDPQTAEQREETGQGMGATLLVAEQHQGYTLTDRATYLALRDRLTLVPLFEGAPSLLNVYHAYVVNPEKHPDVRLREARAFVAFMVAPATQHLIGDFGRARFGQPLFHPDAGKHEDSLALSGSARERSGAGIR
jgi:tungstate transport system substrate-binding protein